MLPLYYNATIILTIIASFSIGKFLFKSDSLSKVLGSIVTIFWIYWTLGGSEHFGHEKLWHFKLIFFQIAESIFLFIICFAILNWLSEKEKKIKEKDKQIDESQNTIKKLLEDRERIDNRELIEYIQNNQKTVNIKVLSRLSQHIELLYDTLENANHSVCILSGTATSYVVDEEFKDTVMECLKKGVNIYIGYGYSSSYSEGTKKDYNIKAEEELKKLVTLSEEKKVKGKIFVADYKNHSKILICDDKYVVCGSFNWLSNARGQNIERSYVINDKKIVIKESDAIKKYIKRNVIK